MQTICFAQPLQFKHLTVDNGLNVNSVNDILKDKNGFIWMATSDGICRYDGRNFKQYHLDKNKPNSLHSYIYTSILEDAFGNIWLSGENGVEVVEAKTGNVKLVLKDDVRSNVYLNMFFHNINNGKQVLQVSQNATINIFDTEKTTLIKTVKVPTLQLLGSKMMGGLAYYTFKKEDGNTICFLNDNMGKIIEYNSITNQFTTNNTNLPTDILASNVTYINKGLIRFLTIKNNFISLVEFNTNTSTIVKKIPISKESSKNFGNLASNYYYDSVYKKSFIGIGGVGLYEYDDNFNLINIYSYNGQNPQSISGNLFFSRILNINNHLWVITNPSGVSFANLQKSTFTNYSSNVGLPDLCKGIFTDHKGNIYNMPVGMGTKYYNAKNGENITNTIPAATLAKLNKVQYLAFNSTIPLGNNKVLMRTPRNFVVYNFKTYEVKNYEFDLLKKVPHENVLYYSQAYCINENNILLENNKILYNLTLNDNSTIQINNTTNFPETITAIKRCVNGEDWIGTPNGVFIHTNNGSIKFLEETKLTLIKHIIQASDSSIYIASLGGVYHYNTNGILLHKFTTQNGLSNNFCYTIIEDDLKNVWISNNMGLNKYNPSTNTFTNYTQSDGLQGNEFNSNAFHKDSSGRLYFGGINGITAFTPDTTTKAKNNFAPHIIAIAINDKWFNKDTAAWNIKQLKLPHNKNTISLEYAAMNLVNEAAQTYFYKLDGYDKDWIDGGRNTVVRYPDLPAGTYSFLLKTKQNGEETISAKLIEIIITPAFYQTWWFYLLVALATILLIGKFFQAINKRKYQKKLDALKLQEDLETERQRISRDLHDNMGAYTSALIANVQQLKTNIGENEHTQKMQTNAESILNSLRETIWVLNNKEITLQEFNDGFKNYCFKVLRNFEHINFNAQENITINPLLKASVAIHLNKIMQEIIQNCIKHAVATEINYTINDTNGLQISITDNGKGFSTKENSKGFGLDNMQWRAKEAGLQFAIETQPNKGTSITIKSITDSP